LFKKSEYTYHAAAAAPAAGGRRDAARGILVMSIYKHTERGAPHAIVLDKSLLVLASGP